MIIMGVSVVVLTVSAVFLTTYPLRRTRAKSARVHPGSFTDSRFVTPKPETRNPNPETRNPKPETRDLKPETRNPKPESRA